MSWADILNAWDLVEADLHDIFGVDVGDDKLLAGRSWRWLRTRIVALLSTPVGHDLAGNPIFRSRLQAHFAPPPDTAARHAR